MSSTVFTRVMTLNEHFRPVSWPLQLDIQNPDGMTISRKVIETKDLIIKDVMKIPDNPVYGNWTVTAKYVNGLKTTSAVRFEVKEYVLPTISISFHIPDTRKIILPAETHFHMAVGARYMYGKPVKGHVTVTYGLLWHGHIFTVGKQRNLQLNDTGFTECGITMDDLRLPVQGVWFPNGGKLHVQVAVTEAASGRIEKAEDSSVVFADHLYVIRFTRSDRHFKPGLPYVLEIDVFKANGELGSSLPLSVDCQIDTQDDQKETLLPDGHGPDHSLVTDARGKLSVQYFIPPNTKQAVFKVSPKVRSRADQSNNSGYYFNAAPFYSPSSVYMQVHAMLTDAVGQGEVQCHYSSMCVCVFYSVWSVVMVNCVVSYEVDCVVSFEVDCVNRYGSTAQVGDYLTVLTRYTSPEDIATVTIVVISRGSIVWQVSTRNIQGNSTFFHFKITQDMGPAARIVAFAVRGEGPGSEVISDSVWLEIVPRCDGELSIQRENDGKRFLRPGDIGTVTLTGLPHMVVGVVAVDSAVYHLKNSSLTRQSVFQQMSAHDRGCGFGGGKDVAKVFENSGLMALTNAGLTMTPKTVDGCVDKAVRKKRSGEARKRARDICCVEGARVHNATLALCYFATQELKKTMTPELCIREFFQCCRNMVKGTLSLDALGRLKTTTHDRRPDDIELTFDEDDMSSFKNIPVRTNFPESWWFEEYNLG
ncbi:hypothetical protein Btru_021034, partial [Bulinus truncatus]